jgi:hypothetical protein
MDKGMGNENKQDKELTIGIEKECNAISYFFFSPFSKQVDSLRCFLIHLCFFV